MTSKPGTRTTRKSALWSATTFLAIAALPVYLPASLLVSLGPLDAAPWPLTIVVLAAAATSAHIGLRERDLWAGALRPVILTGSVMAILGAFGWVGYVELLSGTLAPDRGPALSATAPPIETTDPEGRSFSLQRALEHGPVLLVFYRAHW